MPIPGFPEDKKAYGLDPRYPSAPETQLFPKTNPLYHRSDRCAQLSVYYLALAERAKA